MGWLSDDCEHEGWDATEFPGGRFSVGTGNGGVLVRFLRRELDTGAEPEVVDGQTAIGWRGVCECGWRGPLWERVSDPLEHDLAARKAFDPVGDKWATTPAGIDDAIHREWLGHLKPARLVDITVAAGEVRAAEARLVEAVRWARGDGRSWAEIGEATGITRQSAHERWAQLTPVTDVEIARRALADARAERSGASPRTNGGRGWPGGRADR